MMGPLDYDWMYGTIPKVENVPYDCMYFVWSDTYKGYVFPHGDNLNPVRWCSDSYYPIDCSPECWYIILKEGVMTELPPDLYYWDDYFIKLGIRTQEEFKKELGE